MTLGPAVLHSCILANQYSHNLEKYCKNPSKINGGKCLIPFGASTYPGSQVTRKGSECTKINRDKDESLVLTIGEI